MFFHGSCAQDDNRGFYGKRMRLHIVRGIQDAALERVSVTCTTDRPVVPDLHSTG